MKKRQKIKNKKKLIVQKINVDVYNNKRGRVKIDVLVPIIEDKKKLKTFFDNQLLSITITGHIPPRSVKMHRKFFALVNKLVENANGFISQDQALEWLKLKIGYIEEYIVIDGKHTHLKTKSISFENMEQFEFNGFFKKAIIVIADTLGVTEEELLESEGDI